MIQHLGIIMDGNRRFSKRLLKEPWHGHKWGKEKFREVLEWTRDAGITELTLYAFSLQNFDRPKKEFDHLMDLFIKACDEMLSQSEDESVRVRFVGEINRFPEEVSSRMRHVMERTKDNTSFRLNIAVAYGGREEIVSAVKIIAERVATGEVVPGDIDMQMISDVLYVQSEPDLIIRTGGDRRTSNFLVWQSWYSEWCFVESLWPEFSKQEFLACIEEFSSRQRRFGR